jgi:phosphatidylglycerophosphatase A
MPVLKESSDELNPLVVTAGVIVTPPANQRSLSDYLALAIATCGVGYLPVAPGTWGSIVGVGLYLLWSALSLRMLHALTDDHSVPIWFDSLQKASTLGLVFCVTMAGIWAATRVEKLSGRKDPGIVVIDEVAGQLLTFVFVPLLLWAQWPLIVAGFLLFRLFDIWKPYPIRRLEALEAGLGIMADDVLAGIYAATVMSLLTSIYLLL